MQHGYSVVVNSVIIKEIAMENDLSMVEDLITDVVAHFQVGDFVGEISKGEVQVVIKN